MGEKRFVGLWLPACVVLMALSAVACGSLATVEDLFDDVPEQPPPEPTGGGTDGSAPGDDGGVADGESPSSRQDPVPGRCAPGAAPPRLPKPTIAAGDDFSCARLDDGRVKCWGRNRYGQLGLGDKNARGGKPGEMGPSLPSVDLGPGRYVVEIAANGEHACARLDDGSLKCWGENRRGQLGLGDTSHRGDDPGEMGAALPSVDLGPGRTAVEDALGLQHTCARLDDGSVKCWGSNAYGQLGLGDAAHRGDDPGEMGAALPKVDLGPGRTAVEVVASAGHTCARLDDGSVKCWGQNYQGALGQGDEVARGDKLGQMGAALSAIDLGPGRRAVELTTQYYGACARLDDCTIKCWGENENGGLGLGDKLDRGNKPGQMGSALPVVDLGATAATVVGGLRSGACALLTDLRLKCWGYNGWGRLGLGDKITRGDGPGQMGAALPALDFGAGRTVTMVAVGDEHACVRLDDKTIRCWGSNLAGQLGLGDTLSRGGNPGEMGAWLPAVQVD